VQVRAGQYDRALEDYARALAIMPNAARALYGRGVAKRLKGDLRGGDADIEMARALRPSVADEMAERGVKP
jgi:Flp pilus assembly protein TadD